MAVTLTTVTGTMELPNGATPHRGRVIFTMTGWAKDAPHLFVAGSVDVAVASDGSFSAQLQSTDDLDVEYDVVFSHVDLATSKDVSTQVGRILVPSSGPVTLASVLPVRIPGGASNQHRLKRGDTLSLAGICLDENGRRQNLSGISVSSALRGPDGATRSLVVTIVSAAAGEIEISLSAAQSALLPVGIHTMDVKFSSGVRVVRTLDAQITVEAEVTP